MCFFLFFTHFSTPTAVTFKRDTTDVVFQHTGEDCSLITVLSINGCLHFDIRELLSWCCHRHIISSDGCASAAYVVMYIQRAIFNLCTGLMASALY